MQVHEITQGPRLDEGWMDTVTRGAQAVAGAARSGMGSHFVAGLTGQNPEDISSMFSGQPSAAAQVAARADQKPETPAEVLSRVQKDLKIQQLIGNMEKEWRKHVETNPVVLPEAVDSGYQPLPGSASGIVVPAGMTRPVPAPATPSANTGQQQDRYEKMFIDWARTKLKTSNFDPTIDPGIKTVLDTAAKDLATAALKNNSAGITTAFKNYMNQAIAAVQIHTAQNAKKTSPTLPSNNPAAAGAADVSAVLQKAKLTQQQLVALGRAVGIPTGQRVKNTGNEQLNNIIRAMGIQVLA